MIWTARRGGKTAAFIAALAMDRARADAIRANPRTATGADLDALAASMGLERPVGMTDGDLRSALLQRATVRG